MQLVLFCTTVWPVLFLHSIHSLTLGTPRSVYTHLISNLVCTVLSAYHSVPHSSAACSILHSPNLHSSLYLFVSVSHSFALIVVVFQLPIPGRRRRWGRRAWSTEHQQYRQWCSLGPVKPSLCSTNQSCRTVRLHLRPPRQQSLCFQILSGSITECRTLNYKPMQTTISGRQTDIKV